jgi:hypothetical protein
MEKNIFIIYKTSYFNEEANCTEPSLLLVFPGTSDGHKAKQDGLTTL